MYELIFAKDAVEELRNLESPLERRKVFAAIQCLSVDPAAMGIARAVDAQGHVNRVGVIGGVAFTFFADHALGKLRITAIHVVAE